MDPVSLGIMAVGLGLQAYGGFSAAGRAKEASQISQNIAADEQKINDQKRTQMELEARRMQMQTFRNAQRLRAQATAAAVNQGASKGSGLQGGLAQIQDYAAEGLTNIGQNLEIGRNIFSLNDDISAQKQRLASIQGEGATEQALASLGGSLVKYGPTIGGLAKDYTAGFGSSSRSSFNPYNVTGSLY